MTKKINITIWDRNFNIPIEYDCYKGEEVTADQIKALEVFLKKDKWLKDAKKKVEKYCRKEVINDDENAKKDNVFSYLKPEAIFVKRDKSHPRVALMCKYRYDLEHGLAIVFSHNGDVKIGSQDIIL